MANYRIRTDLKKQIQEWKRSAIQQVEQFSDSFVDVLGELFAERARNNLLSVGYNVEKYATKYNIYYDPYLKQVVVRKPIGSSEPDIMWYLEFGTGITGKNNPHPEAAQNGWLYAINENTVKEAGSPWARVDGKLGWFFSTKGNEEGKSRDPYLAEEDNTNFKNKVLTSGIPPARYIYNTMLQIDELIELAKQKMNAERK